MVQLKSVKQKLIQYLPNKVINYSSKFVLFDFSDLNEASLLWNLKIRYEKELIYVSIGQIFNRFKTNSCSTFELKNMNVGTHFPKLNLFKSI